MGSSAFRTAKSPGRWVSKRRALGGGVVLERVVAVQMILRDVQRQRDVRAKFEIVSSWKLESSSTFQPSSRELSIMAVTGTPILPPTCTVTPDSRRMWPIRLVVVVLPLEPVMPMVRPSETGRRVPLRRSRATPRWRAVFQRRKIGGHVGREHDEFGSLRRPRAICCAKGMFEFAARRAIHRAA